MPRRTWKFSEERILIEHYEVKTIAELQQLLPSRSADMINSKIKRLKALGRLGKEKTQEAVARAYRQRGKEVS